MYQSLVNVGFKHKQIEDAMLNTVPYGQDLMDCLDWLCLNTNNGKTQIFCNLYILYARMLVPIVYVSMEHRE